jgi:YMGG-like Gly-zipper
MRNASITIIALGTAVLLTGCVTPPMGPEVNVIPGPHKSFAEFQQDQAACEDYANRQVAGGAQAANNRAVGAAAIGTGLGAAIGAATGGGRSTATGAAIGAIVGTAAGSNISARAQYRLQRRYDMAYVQCMSARGNEVPGYGASPRGYGPPPPPAGYPPPPPPGSGGY